MPFVTAIFQRAYTFVTAERNRLAHPSLSQSDKQQSRPAGRSGQSAQLLSCYHFVRSIIAMIKLAQCDFTLLYSCITMTGKQHPPAALPKLCAPELDITATRGYISHRRANKEAAS
jgi:hypothetical protein